jgi:hypothetical protein
LFWSLFFIQLSIFNSQLLEVCANVATEILVGELYLLGFLKRLTQCLGLVASIRGYCDYPSSGSHNMPLFHGGATVEYDAALYLFDA